METLGSIFIIILLFYSLVGGLFLFADYTGTSIDPEQKDYKKQSSKANRIFLTKLIMYTLIVCIPTYFMEDLSDFFGAGFDKKHTLFILAVPFILWACTLMVVIVNLFEKEKP